MNFIPLFDRILVEPITAEETIGGLYIPDTSTNLKKGIVIAAGDCKSVKEGMEILYEKRDATPLTMDGIQYVVMKENVVWMIKK